MRKDLLQDEEVTRDADLATWHTFCQEYYEPIVRAFRLMRLPEDDARELAHTFVLKVHRNNFLDTYRARRQALKEEGKTLRFRTYLYQSLKHHALDHHFRPNRASRPQGLTAEATEALEAGPVETLDPDALYALDILHQALQALRRHCERTGKPHLWVFFEESYLAHEFSGRQAKTRAELLAAYPHKDASFLDNSLTTAKRSFRRLVQEVIPRGLRDGSGGEEHFREWMEILRDSHASQYNLLHLAYRVTPSIASDTSCVPSATLRADELSHSRRETVHEEPARQISDDELSILLSFRLELPLTEMLDVTELQRYVPSLSPFWRNPLPAPAAAPGRPLCLLTLIAPSPAEAAALATTDVVALLDRLKLLAKQLHHRPDHALPSVFSHLLYTLAIVIGFFRYQVKLHTISDDQLLRNLQWFLKRPWIDSRLLPLFEQGAAAMGAPDRSV